MLQWDMLEPDGETAGLASPRPPPLQPPPAAPVAARPAVTPWLQALVAEQFDFVWRSLRRLGVPPSEVDDATQKVFLVALRRADDVGQGRERAFLFGTALHVAAEARRARTRSRTIADEEAVARSVDPGSSPEELLDRKWARERLDEVLEGMDLDLRAVFVLVELEEMTAPEIAETLGLPIGTVASRLRRAREEFHAAVRRLRARGPRPVVGSEPARSPGRKGRR